MDRIILALTMSKMLDALKANQPNVQICFKHGDRPDRC